MSRFGHIAALREALQTATRRGQRIGFVPTMGALHEGHLSLIRLCAATADKVVVSIFVNPLQFGPSEDFGKYPRDPDADVAKATAAGADICFLPDTKEMYPTAQAVHVQPGDAATRWEGAARPGHFEGVLTVVAKLLNIVNPDITVFGQKDYQQAVLVRAMVSELSFRTSISIGPTVRDSDGLALSSRNAYLTPDMREKAVAIPKSLASVVRAWQSGEAKAGTLRALALDVLARGGIGLPEYLAIVEPASLAPVDLAQQGSVLLVAARVGGTRLIDNVVLDGTMTPGLEAAMPTGGGNPRTKHQ